MKISENGAIRDMTAEEEAAYKAMVAEQQNYAPEPTTEERIAALETDVVKHTTDITDMKEELDLILSGVTE